MDLYEGFQSQNSNKQLFCKRVSLQKVSDGALTKGRIMKFTRFTSWAGGYSGQRPLVLACQCWTADQRTALCRLPAARWSLPHRETICRSLTEDWEAKHCLSQTKGNLAVYAEKKESYQVPGAVRSSQVTLDVRVEDLDCRLDEAAARKMLLILDERQPRLQELVVGLHVNHVILIQLSKERKRDFLFNAWTSSTSDRLCSFSWDFLECKNSGVEPDEKFSHITVFHWNNIWVIHSKTVTNEDIP